jgi:hypothetical protein
VEIVQLVPQDVFLVQALTYVKLALTDISSTKEDVIKLARIFYSVQTLPKTVKPALDNAQFVQV